LQFGRRATITLKKEKETVKLSDRIVVDPAVLVGKPCVKGTRLSVDFLLGLLAQGWSEAEVLRNYPGLTHEDMLACLEYASRVIGEERVYAYQVA
jgi:uncharacterized protein (DUF433 family)